jgi:hypothetical protein
MISWFFGYKKDKYSLFQNRIKSPFGIWQGKVIDEISQIVFLVIDSIFIAGRVCGDAPVYTSLNCPNQ